MNVGVTVLGSGLILVSYLVGAVPVGLLVARWQRGIDIRRYGSGSTGATNVLRTLGWQASALVFGLDLLKTVLSVYFAGSLTGSAWVQAGAGVAAIVGHCWPIYTGGTGGRGSTSSLGGLLVIQPYVAIGCLLVAVVGVAKTRFVSFGSLAGVAFGTIVMAYLVVSGMAPIGDVVYVIGSPAIVFIRHRENIVRLRDGRERKLGEDSGNSRAPSVG